MSERIDYEQILAEIDVAWQLFLKSFEGLIDGDLSDPTAVGYWSVGDLWFHIAYCDEEAAGDAQYRHDHDGAEPPHRDWDEVNEREYLKQKGRTPEEGLELMIHAHQAMLDAFETLREDDLTWTVYELAGHYEGHTGDIRHWRDSRNNS
ncbi:hypothetical protein BH09CHL1_BH09CHL1_05050 [soil metagenome]